MGQVFISHKITVSLRTQFALVGDDAIGYYVQPTVILTKDPRSVTMMEEIFGPVLTVSLPSCDNV